MLNDLQLTALRAEQHAHVEAPPGTGKTHLVAAKVEREVGPAIVAGRLVACVTYTNAARDEIRERLNGALSSDERAAVRINTVHGFCLSEIVANASVRLGYIDGARIATPETPAYTAAALATARAIFGDSTSEQVTPVRDVLKSVAWRDPDGRPTGRNGVAFSPESTRIALRFWDELKALGRLDYNSVLYESLRALEDPEMLAQLASRFAWLIVDEYQDSTRIQLAIFRRLAQSGRVKLFLVGDRNQSIYGFGGANIAESLVFPQGLAAEDFDLTQTYRLPHAIATICDYVFMRGLEPAGEAATVEGQVRFVSANPAQFVLDEFLPRCDALGISPENRALLAANNWNIDAVASELRRNEVAVSVQKSSTQEEAAWLEHLIEMILLGAFALTGYERSRSVAHCRLILDQFDALPLESAVQSAFTETLEAKLIQAGRALAPDLPVDIQAVQILHVLRDAMVESSAFPALAAWNNFRPHLNKAWPSVRATGFGNRTLDNVVSSLRPRSTMRAMTIHGAKGQQFDAVALLEFDLRVLPDYRSITPSSKWEELRRLYVAISRPRRLLYIQSSRGRESRFIGILKGEASAESIIEPRPGL